MSENFQLPDSENQRVYQEEIEPFYFSRTTPTDKPRAVIVGGQPGAGKTRVRSNRTKVLFLLQTLSESALNFFSLSLISILKSLQPVTIPMQKISIPPTIAGSHPEKEISGDAE